MNVCAKFRCAPLRIKKALGIFRELITTRTTRVVFGTRLPGAVLKNNLLQCTGAIKHTKKTIKCFFPHGTA